MSYNDDRREKRRIKPEWETRFNKFTDACRKRMKRGHRGYGDRSYERPLTNLLQEIEEELLDDHNWRSVAWYRVNRLKEKVRLLEDRLDEAEMAVLLEEIEEVEEETG